MTETTSERTTRRRAPARPLTFFDDIADRIRDEREAEAAQVATVTWPSAKYAADPVAFAREILGVRLWKFQVDFLEAIRDNKRIATSGGRKIGKDFAVAVAALWWYASFPDARVVITATTAHQVERVLWRDIRTLFIRSGRCLDCKTATPDGPTPCPHSAVLTGDLHELARSGLVSTDREHSRYITGHTASEAESMAGTSGSRLMYVLDEASAIKDEIHKAVRGNLASGDSREVMISNPTRMRGAFFDAFHRKASLYKTLQVSSETSPNVIEGRDVIPGLASREWIEEQKRDWGPDSGDYKIHVEGKFDVIEQGRIINLAMIDAAQTAWATAHAEGRLCIGFDPAGDGEDSDESMFAPRRGKKLLGLTGKRGMREDGALVELRGIVAEHGIPGERPPLVAIDCNGYGYKVYKKLKEQLEAAEGETPEFILVPVFSSNGARREPLVYDRIRDELYACLRAWLQDGGAIVSDVKLEEELHAAKWRQTVKGRKKATSKDDLKKLLGRSPDRGDALGLSTWLEALESIDDEAKPAAPVKRQPDVRNDLPETIGGQPSMNPWDGMKAWGG